MTDPDVTDEAQRWLRYSREDLETAELMLSGKGLVPRLACWLAQQSAEKAIKAALVSEQIDFPFRHDLDALRNLLPANWGVKTTYPDLAELTEWAVESRYPGNWPDPTLDDATRAVDEARGVYNLIKSDFDRASSSTGGDAKS